MKTIHKLITGALGAVALTTALPALSATPGQGWDVFHSGAYNQGTGEPVGVYRGDNHLYLQGQPGQGWDVFHSGAYNEGTGERIAILKSTTMTSSRAGLPGQGWDAFNTAAINQGTGEAIPQSSGYRTMQATSAQ